MDNKKTWFITGASKGFGLSLVRQLLNQGQRVAATSRNLEQLKDVVGTDSPSFLPLQVDLGSDSSVKAAIDRTVETFERIDVVVNNAGYGIGGSIEELSDKESRDSFDINVFGTLHVIRHVMPIMRRQHSGHIFNISSIAGIAANTGWAMYAATKFSIVGLTEVLAEDVREFGVKVTIVAPGAFRTSFLTKESLALPECPIAEYQSVRESHEKYLQMNGQQAGDPEKAAAAIIQTATAAEPPLYLLLGEDAYNRAMRKLEFLAEEFKRSEELARSMAYHG
ncbi:SDR family NAD(P)-dependent oxidoreductase [Desertivirga xinjiangensis]|uniref:SDR family NAD(P)-dependent oxidoreductase n=1 Tax=Desertivirga xinjiangensis TaxID=539206 RepID=UPI00210E4846|nr:SDR family NAD(P)-dependent oxidoreductase [Pedobacter xinjiangensis]